MSYIVQSYSKSGTVELASFEGSANEFEKALAYAKSEVAASKESYPNEVEESSIVTEKGTELWNSKDDEELKKYEEYSYDNWKTATKGHHETRDKPSIYFDIDGTLGKWYSDRRGFAMEELLDPANHYFRDIEPHEVMIALAENLYNNGVDVCIISAADKDTIRDKWDWIEEHLPFIPKENICFCPLGADKSAFVKDNAEISILIDDYSNNLEEWKGTAIKAINTVNSHQNKFSEIDFTRYEAMLDEKKSDVDEDILMNEAYVIAKAVERVTDNLIESLRDISLKTKDDISPDQTKKNSMKGYEDMLQNKLAEDIEQFMFERGEYDFPADDTIRWIGKTKGETVDKIKATFETDLSPLLEYLKDEIAVIDKEDELLETAENLLGNVAYEQYKKEWVQDHIDEITMTETQSLYENTEEARGMTFDEYLNEFGYANGEMYVCKEEFLENELKESLTLDDLPKVIYDESEWKNYGDVNFEEYGGILLKENGANTFDVIQVVERDDDAKICLKGSIDINDYTAKEENIRMYAGLDETSSKEDYAIAILDYYGLDNLTSINNESPTPHFDNCVVSPKELRDFLKDIGFAKENAEKDLSMTDKFEIRDDMIVWSYVNLDCADDERVGQIVTNYVDMDNIKDVLQDNVTPVKAIDYLQETAEQYIEDFTDMKSLREAFENIPASASALATDFKNISEIFKEAYEKKSVTKDSTAKKKQDVISLD